MQWIDTCCIDKTSSTELTEAINSMFTWYRNSAACYVYLRDVPSGEDPIPKTSSFSKSRWFTRGWTLQELIAPPKLIFYSREWKRLGTRNSLARCITRITGIDADLFKHATLGRYSIAQRMSWSSQRQTTRVEDQAYCLLGLFGITMPLLYGEGAMAFARLQEEIMRHSDDHSIFAWTPSSHWSAATLTVPALTGMLASSPADFANSGHIIPVSADRDLPPYSITNRGVQITLPVIDEERCPCLPFVPLIRFGDKIEKVKCKVRFSWTPADTLAVINCRSTQRGPVGMRIAIPVHRSGPLEPYYRVHKPVGLVPVPVSVVSEFGLTQTLHIRALIRGDEVPLWKQIEEDKEESLVWQSYRDREEDIEALANSLGYLIVG